MLLVSYDKDDGKLSQESSIVGKRMQFDSRAILADEEQRVRNISLQPKSGSE